jgi:exodeoxyribonuclease-1
MAGREFAFRDPRLSELLFRYRARNWPQTLDMDEHARWNQYRRLRLLTDSGLSEITLPEYFAQISALRSTHIHDDNMQTLLDQLQIWGHQLQADL